MSAKRWLTVEPLTASAFAPYGQTIAVAEARHSIEINEGYAIRHDDLAVVEVGSGRVSASIFSARRRPLPIEIRMMERHPLGSQAFMPLSAEPWLAVVADDEEGRPKLSSLRCFRADGDQGVNYDRGVWHHPLLILAERQDFLVIDRNGPEDNLEEFSFSSPSDRRWISVDSRSPGGAAP